MKKITLMIAVVAMFFAANAQDEFLSKRGMAILPEAGDYSIGINATPFLQYAGNVFNGNMGNAAPTFGWTAANPMEITGKYMVDANTAYRGIIRIGFTSTKQKFYSTQDGQTAAAYDANVTVEDTYGNTQMNIGLGAGMEKRRGNGRLQGVYGAMAMLSFATDKDKYEYGNAYSSTNMAPTRNNFNGNDLGGAWVIDNKAGTTIGFNAYAFVGAEYFIAPKLSISGEFMWGLGFAKTGEGTLNYEYWGVAPAATAAALNTQEVKTAGNGSFGIDTDISATLNLNFYF
jgi:hypothetical protein